VDSANALSAAALVSESSSSRRHPVNISDVTASIASDAERILFVFIGSDLWMECSSLNLFPVLLFYDRRPARGFNPRQKVKGKQLIFNRYN
jgi:hypothetical protein